MGDHIWLVRNPGGRVLSASVQNVGGALNELANAGNGNHHRAYMHFFRECWEDYPNHKDRYEHNGYTLTREPLPTGTAGVGGSDLRFVDVCAFNGLLPSAVTVLRRLGIGGRIRGDEDRDQLSWLASRLQWAMDQESAALAAATGMGEQSDA